VAFRVTFDVGSTYNRFVDTIIWPVVKDISAKDLIKFIFKYLKETKPRIILTGRLHRKTMGVWEDYPDRIYINTKIIYLHELPSVIIHECLHGIFPQLESENKLHILEYKVMKIITLRQINKLYKEVFNGRWKYSGPITRNVGRRPTKFKKK